MSISWTLSWSLLELFINCIDLVYVMSLPAVQLGCKDWVQRKHLVCYGALWAISTTFYNYFTANSISVLYMTLAIIGCYCSCFIRGQPLWKLFWAITPMALLYGIEMSSFWFLIYVHGHISLDVFSLPNQYRLQFFILSRSFQIALLIFLLRNRLQLYNFNYVLLLPAILCCFFSALLLSYIELVGLTSVDKPITETVLIRFAAAFLVINLFNSALILQLQKRHQEILQSYRDFFYEQIELQQTAFKQKKYEEAAVIHEKMKEFQEDVQEKLRSLWSLAKIHKMPQINNYLTRISHINQKFERLYQTGDDVIDAVLFSKDIIASTCHIELKTSIRLPPPGVINSNDLGNILINLLDNAIIAQHNLIPAKGDRVIMITMNIDQSYYLIAVKNPTNSRERCSQRRSTALSLSQNTGVGLKIVRGLVDQYGGNLQIKHEDFFFTVLIRLPVNNNLAESEKQDAGKDRFAIDQINGQPKYH